MFLVENSIGMETLRHQKARHGLSDLEMIEKIITHFYGSFDNRAPRVPDGRSLVEMFMPGAMITCLKEGVAVSMSLEEFTQPRLELLQGGRLINFHEWEIEGQTKILRDIATHWSLYRKEGELDGAAYGGGGRKLMQLCRSEGRWLITSLLWADD